MIKIIYKKRNQDEVNFRLTIERICRLQMRNGMFNAWEILDLLKRTGVTKQNNGKNLTKGFIHVWFSRIGYRRKGDWFFIK